jgi:hypothetical protein
MGAYGTHWEYHWEACGNKIGTPNSKTNLKPPHHSPPPPPQTNHSNKVFIISMLFVSAILDTLIQKEMQILSKIKMNNYDFFW